MSLNLEYDYIRSTCSYEISRNIIWLKFTYLQGCSVLLFFGGGGPSTLARPLPRVRVLPEGAGGGGRFSTKAIKYAWSQTQGFYFLKEK